MAIYYRIMCLKTQPHGTDNRISITWEGPDNVIRTYSVNQNTLNNFTTAEQLKAALDDWTQKSFGYVLNDVWFHLNRDGSWAVATGAPPAIWPEDQTL